MSFTLALWLGLACIFSVGAMLRTPGLAGRLAALPKFLFFFGAGAVALGVAALLVEGVAPPSAAELGSTGVSEAWFEALEALQQEQRSGFVALAFVVGVTLVLAGMVVRDLRGFVTLHTQDLAARDQIALHGERGSAES